MSSVVYRILTSAFYLRVQVPTGDTTMLQVEETTTIAEVQKLVEEKKMQVYKDCNLFAVLTDGKKIPVWEDVTLANYKTIEKMVMGIFC
jgi:hypothetical protein